MSAFPPLLVAKWTWPILRVRPPGANHRTGQGDLSAHCGDGGLPGRPTFLWRQAKCCRIRLAAELGQRAVDQSEANMRSLSAAILVAVTAWAGTAISDDDAFKQAVNYVFSGNVEGRTPQLLISIVDENKCIISVETPGNSFLYYLKEIRPGSIMIDENTGKISFEGDSTVVEHTFEQLPKVDRDNKGSITLRGDIERTRNALELIFSKYCVPKSG
jgi:hypothetical protein